MICSFVFISSVCSIDADHFVELLGLSCVYVSLNHHCVCDDFVEMRADGKIDSFTVFLDTVLYFPFLLTSP